MTDTSDHPNTRITVGDSSDPQTGSRGNPREEILAGAIMSREQYDLDMAMSRNRRRNPGNGENSEARTSTQYFERMLAELRSAVPRRYGNSTQPPTIYTVPEELTRSIHHIHSPRGEYEPVAVGIGSSGLRFRDSAYPYAASVKQFDNYKWCCVRRLIGRHRSRLQELDDASRTRVLLDRCLESMERLEPQIMASYHRGAWWNSRGDELAATMLLDGCFILHRLLKYARRAEKEATGGDLFDDDDDDDWTQVYGRCWVWQLVTRDLLLLENQIPFKVIRELFKQVKNGDEAEDILVTGSLRLFRSLRPQMLHSSPIACDGVHHLLHLFHLSVGFPPSDSQLSPRQAVHELPLAVPELPQWIPCAKDLEEAGVRFRVRKNATSFLDIKFVDVRGILEIPQLQLDDFSESLFRNLIAFEQTYPNTRRDISTYAAFMDCLITSEKDMRILELHGVLVSHLNSAKPAWQFFGRISAQMHWSTDNYLVGVMGAVNKYRDSKRHGWRAALVRNHLSDPWVVMSLVAALLLLAMTVLQTFFSVYAYYKPPK